jgi:hypothetical protein
MRIPSILAAVHKLAPITLGASLALALAGCPSAGGGTTPKWPRGSSITPTPLPSDVQWQGVYFISTPGTRGTMHLLGGEEGIHGCWIAEDKHATAKFSGKVKDNVALFDWTEKQVGHMGAPTRATAYLVLTPDPEHGKHKIAGEYGENLSDDGGSKWEGIRQPSREPSDDGCKLDKGDAVGVDSKPLD